KDVLARLLSLCNDHVGAVELARKAVETGVNQILPQATLVEVLHRAGKIPETTTEFTKLRSLAGTADLDLPIFERLKPLAEALQYPADWRTPNPPSTDVGIRPDLNSLGPFRWEPSPAVTWSLTSSSDQTVSLEQYRGKPVIVIFYLGAGCLHCVEQLKQFASKHDEFTAAGLPIVAISSESLDSLKRSIEDFDKEKPIPFPLLADPSLEVFRKYRAHDDFENLPLHGTFLIDSQGLVRWQDISFEPFTNTDFLIKEARRLLGTP
ncbi:MAG: peroxiredoxin family protein, partial [Planctomycetaceae bacterium]|nr:peroxiredoxin family protein [Planctomycetaceae bacterium]